MWILLNRIHVRGCVLCHCMQSVAQYTECMDHYDTILWNVWILLKRWEQRMVVHVGRTAVFLSSEHHCMLLVASLKQWHFAINESLYFWWYVGLVLWHLIFSKMIELVQFIYIRYLNHITAYVVIFVWVFLLGWRCSRKAKSSIVSNRVGLKFAGLLLR